MCLLSVHWTVCTVTRLGPAVQQCIIGLYKKQLYLLAGWCSGDLRGQRGPQQPLTHTAVLQVQSLSRAQQFLLLLGLPAQRGGHGVLIITKSNMQAWGQTQTVTLPSQHQNLDRSQDSEPCCSLGEQGEEGWGGGGVGCVGGKCMGGWSSFHFLLSVPLPKFLFWGGGLKYCWQSGGDYAGGRASPLGMVCR